MKRRSSAEHGSDCRVRGGGSLLRARLSRFSGAIPAITHYVGIYRCWRWVAECEVSRG